jgi:uncharacterized protein (TIGR02147 family)
VIFFAFFKGIPERCAYIYRMREVYKYIDFRRYLADYYDEKKKHQRYFSYRFFARQAGIKSPVFLKQVIDGKRNLTLPMIEKFNNALKHNKRESIFFKKKARFNKNTDPPEKQEHYSVLLSMMDYVQERQLSADQYRYFETWYTSVIRELICIHDFQDDYEKIAQAVYPRITMTEAKKAVQLLVRLKLVIKQRDGKYRQTDAAIISRDDMVAFARRSFNSEMILRAREANEALPPSERDVSGITMGISRICYEVLQAEIAAFKERVKTIVNQDEHCTRVYQLNLQLFPVSDNVASLMREFNQENDPCVH